MTTHPDLDHTGDHNHGRHDSGTELCTTMPPAPPASARTDRAAGMHWSYRTDWRIVWAGRHSAELVGVLGPPVLVLAVDWSWPWLGVSVLTAAAWGTHEYRKRRRNSPDARPGALTPHRPDGTHTATDTTNVEENTRGSA